MLFSPLLFMISELIILAVLITLIFHYYFIFSKYEYIWLNSKILTVNEIVQNKKNAQILYDFFDSYVFTLKYSYEDLLKHSTKDNCEENYKQCGILDTYGNKLCLNESLPCPINHILVDLKSKEIEYKNKGYSSLNVFNESSDLQFYYTNNKIDNPVIVDIIYSYSQPKYITYNNFILDEDAIKKAFNNYFDIEFEGDDDNDDENDLIGGIVGTVVEFGIESGISIYNEHKKMKDLNKLIEYIDKKINDDNNKDKYYINIYGNYYVKNYIGFENNEKMYDFLTTDFSPYHTIFPNKLSIYFAITCLFVLVCIIIFDLVKLSEEDYSICSFVVKVIIYGLIFFGFFIYFLVVYFKVFQNEFFSNIKSIKSDDFITNFINELSSSLKNKVFILLYIILFSVSALLFIWNCIKNPLIEYIKMRKEKIESTKKVVK